MYQGQVLEPRAPRLISACMHRPLGNGSSNTVEHGLPRYIILQCLERPVLELGLVGPLPRALKKNWNVLAGRLSHVQVSLDAIEQ